MPIREQRPYTSRQHPKKVGKQPLINDHDHAIFDVLLRRPFASSDDLIALIGGERTNFQERLLKLTAWGYLHRPPQQFRTLFANRNPLVYQIGNAATDYLKECGYRADPPNARMNFAHELMACRVMTSFELGTREAAVRLITYQDILAAESTPQETKDAPRPYRIPDVQFILDGKPYSKSVEGDTMPFGIARIIDGKNVYRFTRGIEVDGGTMPIRRLKSEGTDIYEKLLADLAIMKQKLYRSHFGFPSCYFLYVFCRHERVNSAMEILRQITKGEGSPNILFNYFPRFDDDQPWPKPSGHTLTGNWQRVGYPPFNFLTS
jgi:hypothetical protein